jgi:raffinose/stachyose/melibiose transport system substrate-binding protein
MFEAAGSGWPPDMFLGSFTGDAAEGGWLEAIRQREAKFDDPDSPWVRALTFYDQLRDEGCFNEDVLTAEYEDSYTALLEDRAAMVSQHSLASVDAAEAFSAEEVNAKMGFQAWSETHPIVTAAVVPHGTYYLPKTGDPAREAGAVAFLDFMTGPAYADYLAEVGSVPVLQGVTVPDSVLTPLAEALQAVQEYGSIPPVWDYAPGIDIRIATGSVLADQKSPAEAAAQTQVEAAQGARAAGLPTWP